MERFFAGGIGSVLDLVNEDHIATALELAGEDPKTNEHYRLSYSVRYRIRSVDVL